MRFVFFSNPATGQVNPLLAIAQELCMRNHQVFICSSDSVLKRVQKLQAKLGYLQQVDSRPAEDTWSKYKLIFYSLGSGTVLDDYTDEASKDPVRFHTKGRSRPGNIWTWMHTFMDFVPPASEAYKDVVFKMRDMIHAIDADMVIVDNFSPFAVDGARLSKRPFIETCPGAASAVVNNVGIFERPLPMSGGRSADCGLFVFISNIMFIYSWVVFALFNRWPRIRRAFRRDSLGLEPVDLVCDSLMTPTPGMLPQQVATLTFNVSGVDFYPPEAYDRSVFFVGPCFPPADKPGTPVHMPRAPTSPAAFSLPNSVASTPTVCDIPFEKEIGTLTRISSDPVKEWLDKAYENGNTVVYINMGSIFYYSRSDYDNMVKALIMFQEKVPNVQVLWKIPDLPVNIQPIPSADESKLPLFIRREGWLESVQTVLEHPAVKVVAHHGGGNSFNEALYYGHRQFCISQWVDTHDIGAYVKHSGVGLWADKSPEFDADDIAGKLIALVEDKDTFFRRNALSWRNKTKQAGGVTTAANIIESYVTDFDYPHGNSRLPMVA